MTLWHTKEDMAEFIRTGAHDKSMKDINSIAKSFTTMTVDAYNLIPWREAVVMIETEERHKMRSQTQS